MDTFRVGGIASGMDTNALVEQLMQQARIPVERLQGKLTLAGLKKTIYSGFSTSMVGLKTDLLSMRLEATFKSKTLNSSDTSILGATAGTNAALGSHNITVHQTAKNGYWSSAFTRVRLAAESAGITGTSGLPGQFDQIEGTHSVNVSFDGTQYIAKDTFTRSSLGSMDRFTANNQIDTAGFIFDDGELQADVTGGVQFSIDGSAATEVAITATAGEDVNAVLRKLEDGLNARLNEKFNTSGIQYAAIRADYDGTNGWNVAVTNVSNEDYDLDVVGGTLQNSLGLDGGFAKSQADSIDKYYAAADLTSLQAKMNETYGGLIAGVTLNGSLTEGTFELVQDSSLNVKTESYSKVYGGDDVSSGAGLDTTAAGLENAGFAATVDSGMNGTFSINGVKISIGDYTTLSVNDVIGKINSSGAGVTASYDGTNDRLVLTNNDPGADTITLGELSDTSEFLSVAKLSVAGGATKVLGSTKGSVSASSTLSDAGFTSTPTAGTFTINGTSIYIDPTEDTLNDVIAKVNKSGAGVTMSYDAARDRVTVVSDSVGYVSFGAASDTSNFLTATNLTRFQTTTTYLGHEGRYAEVEVDGVTHIRDTNTVDDIIDGVTLNLRSASTSSVTLDVSVDEERAVNAVAQFIQHYNTFMDELNVDMLTDEQREYLDALTETEKASMGESEIEDYEEKWQEYNRQNIIFGSAEVRLMKSSFRTNLLRDVPGLTGKYNNLAELGIDIAGDRDYTVTKKGLLLIDSTDLDEIKQALKDNTTFMNAVRNDPDDVYNFFAEQDEVTDSETGRTTEVLGWARMMTESINDFTDTGGIIYNKIRPYGAIDREMATYVKQMDHEEYRLELELDRLWKQFTAMETAMAEMQSQGDYMAQMLAGMAKK